MTNSQVLQQAIERAIEGGWQQDLVWIHGNVKDKKKAFLDKIEVDVSYIYYRDDIGFANYISIPELIFDHDFARALFGELASYDDMIKLIKHPSLDPIKASTVEPWKYHLMALALSSDRISYLKDYMEKQQ